MSKKADIIYRNAVRELRRRNTDVCRQLLRSLRQTRWGMGTTGKEFDAAMELLRMRVKEEWHYVMRDFEQKRGNYEPLFSMPPARRQKGVPKPVTLVERRAVAAKKKVAAWQRKAKLAATKVKVYRRKVSYYTKKGVIS